MVSFKELAVFILHFQTNNFIISSETQTSDNSLLSFGDDRPGEQGLTAATLLLRRGIDVCAETEGVQRIGPVSATTEERTHRMPLQPLGPPDHMDPGIHAPVELHRHHRCYSSCRPRATQWEILGRLGATPRRSWLGLSCLPARAHVSTVSRQPSQETTHPLATLSSTMGEGEIIETPST